MLISRRAALTAGGLILSAPSIVRAQGVNGAALVIGNSKYQWEASLPNVKRDAANVAERFQSMGLRTELLYDQTRAGMLHAVEKMRTAPHQGRFGFLYFAGHGAAWAKETYLVPTDTDLSTPNIESLVSVNQLGRAISNYPYRLRVFDSCRNNPADGWRQKQALDASLVVTKDAKAEAEKYPNILVMYSAAPGHPALDGPAGQNSPFAAAFLRQFSSDSIDLHEIDSRIRRDLLLASGGRQLLFSYNHYSQPVYFKTSKASASAITSNSARVLELPKIREFARNQNFVLPEGIFALKPLNNATGSKVGSYKFEEKVRGVPSPVVFIVLSVDDSPIVTLVAGGTNPVNGPWWRFLRGTLAGNRMEFAPQVASGIRWVADWKDGNAGSIATFRDQAVQGNMDIASFTRLD